MYRDFFKPLLDFLLSLFGLIILSPLIVLIIICLIFSVGDPVFTQLRPGKNGKLFKIFKFRTMSSATVRDGELLPDNLRITKIGKILRKSSLDEIPQLFNVLKGEMSLVGPRPLLPYYTALYNGHQQKRNRVKPGITGLAQIRGGNYISWYSRFRLDVWYTQHVSLFLDFTILFGTVIFIFSAKKKWIDNIPIDFEGNPDI